MDQQLLMKAQFLHQQLEEMQQHLEILERELAEMQQYHENLSFLEKNKEKKIIASLGKGLHMSANLENNDLYVEVGANVVVKKTPGEAVNIIKFQLDKLREARLHLLGKIEIYQKTLDSAIEEMQNSQSQLKSKEKKEKIDE
jgi:prefoldin alpha subunit